jgi:hypothetical protein
MRRRPSAPLRTVWATGADRPNVRRGGVTPAPGHGPSAPVSRIIRASIESNLMWLFLVFGIRTSANNSIIYLFGTRGFVFFMMHRFRSDWFNRWAANQIEARRGYLVYFRGRRFLICLFGALNNLVMRVSLLPRKLDGLLDLLLHQTSRWYL